MLPAEVKLVSHSIFVMVLTWNNDMEPHGDQSRESLPYETRKIRPTQDLNWVSE